MKKNIDDITWLKLDNAALIYPSTLSRKFACMFRLTITLTEFIDNNILLEALKNIMPRFPSFRFRLKEGFFWCYLEKINKDPIISKDSNNPMLRMDFKKNNYYLFRVRTYKNRLAIEYFHALTDGTGALRFILTLTQEYLRLKYKVKAEYNEYVLDPKESPKKEEIEDAFMKIKSKESSLVRESKAYHLKGTKIKSNLINIVTGIVNTDELKKTSKKYNASITEFISSLVIYSYQQYKKEHHIKNKKDIKVSIPINLRKVYNMDTLRNFSSYVNVGIKPIKEYSLEEIIIEVKKQLKEMTTYEAITSKVLANVKLQKNFFIRRVPMFIKKHIMSLIELKMGDGYITTTLSNLGNIELPDNMKKYVTDMNFILGKSRAKPSSIACIGYNNKVYISFSRNIKESEIEKIFFRTLANMNVNVFIESNR